MSESRCNLCDMKVLNMDVHMRLNHKKKKKEGFRLSGFSSSSQSPAPMPLPSITKYQNTQLTSEKGGKEKREGSKEVSNHSVPNSSEVTDNSSDNKEGLQESLAMLSSLMNQETARKVYKLDNVSESDMKNIFKSGSITREGFELKLKLLGMIKIGNSYRRKDERNVKLCPDCGVSINWNRAHHRKSNLEYFEHIKLCGIGSPDSVEKFTSPKPSHPQNNIAESTLLIIKQENDSEILGENNLAEDINVCVKEEVETQVNLDLIDELKSPKPPKLETENIQSTSTIEKEDNDMNFVSLFCNESLSDDDLDEDMNICVKEEVEIKVEQSNDDLESNIEIKTESLDENNLLETIIKEDPDEYPKIEIKTEVDGTTDFETVSLELTLVENRKSIENQSLVDISMEENINNFGTEEKDEEYNLNNGELEQNLDESLGDAWFKKISEFENKKIVGRSLQIQNQNGGYYEIKNKRNIVKQRKGSEKRNIYEEGGSKKKKKDTSPRRIFPKVHIQ